MTITVAGILESLRTGTTDPHTFTMNQGVTSPKGVLIGVMKGVSTTDYISAVTYGGVALSRIQRNLDSAGEPGVAEWWFRGDSIPSGDQTVSIDLTSGTGDDIHFVCITLNGDRDLEIVDKDGLDVSTTLANPSVTLQYNNRTCMAFAAIYSGLTAHTSITANETTITKITTSELAGSWCSAAFRQITAGSSDFAIAVSSGADDCAYACVAISEIVFGVLDKTLDPFVAYGVETLDFTQRTQLNAALLPSQIYVFGLQEVIGVSSIVINAFTLSSTGTAPASVGIMDTALDDFTVEAASISAIAGQLSKALNPFITSSQGTSSVVGQVDQTLGAFTASSQAVAPVIGALDKTIDGFTLSADGLVVAGVSGDLQQTLEPFTLVADGISPVVGLLDKSLDLFTLTANVVTEGGAFLNVTLGEITLSATGTITVQKTQLGAALLPVQVYGTMTPRASAAFADLAKTLGAFTLSAQGSSTSLAALDKALDPFTLAEGAWFLIDDETGQYVVDESGNRITILGGPHAQALVSGALSVTLGAFTVASIAASAANTGTLDKALGPFIVQSAGSIPVVGTASPVLAAFTAMSAGIVALQGQSAFTLGNFSIASTALAQSAGTLTKTLSAFTVASTGISTSGAILDKALDAFTVQGAAAVQVRGDLSQNLNAFTLSATGGSGLQAVLDKTLDAFNTTAAGQVSVVGALSGSLDGFTLTSQAEAVSGIDVTLDVALDAFTVSASGVSTINGVLDRTLDAVMVSATGTAGVIGALDQSLGDFSLSGQAQAAAVGSFDLSLGQFILLAEGEVTTTQRFGDANILIDVFDLESEVQTLVTGAFDKSLNQVLISSFARAAITGAALIDLGGFTVSSQEGPPERQKINLSGMLLDQVVLGGKYQRTVELEGMTNFE